MPEQSDFETERLALRPFSLDDVSAVQKLAGAREVAYNTLTIPHPYTKKDAKDWIAPQEEKFQEGIEATFAITLKSSRDLIGAIGLVIKKESQMAELGYWVGKPYWHNGYCSEAAREVMRYGFQELGLHRIFAQYFARNPASGRVLEKIGMQYEGHLRDHIKKWGHYEDVLIYGILETEIVHTETP